MKKIILITLIILNILLLIPTKAKEKKLLLDGFIIAIDAGHGGKDIGSSYDKLIEKNLNLEISKKLKVELEKYGATIIMTREGDYDLSKPNARYRKKSDFDNRIKIINNSNVNLFLSIHQNYFTNPSYSGLQIFYKGNKELSEYVQNKINPKRSTYPISNKLYMYNKLKPDGLLIECGFLSNYTDRENLSNNVYQLDLSKKIAKYLKNYYIKE